MCLGQGAKGYITRFPRGQACVSSCRLGKGATASAGTRYGPAGPKIGPASLQWACAAVAVLVLRHQAQGQPSLTRVENQPGQGQALTRVAHKLTRAVY